jgi:hypothetical protein
MAGLADDMIYLIARFLPLDDVASMISTCHVWKHAIDKCPSLQFNYTYSDPAHHIWSSSLARHITFIHMELYGEGKSGEIEAVQRVCRHMPQLTWLRINSLPSSIVRPTSLRFLKFQGNFAGSYLQAAIDALDEAPLLKSLTLIAKNTSTNVNLSAVGRALCLTELRMNYQMSDVARHIAPLLRAPRLRRVWLSRLNQSCRDALIKAGPLPWTFVEFEWYAWMSTPLVNALDILFPCLTHLSIHVYHWKHVPEAIFIRLRHLRVYFNDEDEPVEACLSRCTNLEELRVESNYDGTIDFSHVVLPKLRKLHVHAASIKSLHGNTFPCLREVNLSSTRFQPSVIHELFAIESLTHVRMRNAYAMKHASAIEPVLSAHASRLAHFQHSMVNESNKNTMT